MQFLKDIIVVEFSHMVMGPTTGMILADLGATVVKIEPVGGDKTRSLPGSGSGYFAMFNRNKQSICLDLKSDEGKEVVQKLLADADVVIENFRPGALDKLGFGYDDVKKLNPSIVYQSSKGFLSGPYENRTALDEVAQMMGGLAYMTGPSGKPLRAGSSIIDITGGMFGVIGILAALYNRDAGKRSGDGAFVTSSLYETTAFLVGQHIAQHAVTGKPVPPMPERISAWAVYDVFSAFDAQVFVGVVSDGQWVSFCSEFNIPGWEDDPEFATNTDRVAKRDIIIPRLRSLFAHMQSADLMVKLGRAGLPYAPIRKPEELLNDEHLIVHGLQELTLPDTGARISLPKLPLEMNGARAELRSDLPSTGANTVSIMKSLGYGDEDIKQMRLAGGVL
ncbi:MAG: CaiB/BaiF CoA-transferase family protein [Hyphomicrobiales bacterium]